MRTGLRLLLTELRLLLTLLFFNPTGLLLRFLPTGLLLRLLAILALRLLDRLLVYDLFLLGGGLLE